MSRYSALYMYNPPIPPPLIPHFNPKSNDSGQGSALRISWIMITQPWCVCTSECFAVLTLLPSFGTVLYVSRMNACQTRWTLWRWWWQWSWIFDFQVVYAQEPSLWQGTLKKEIWRIFFPNMCPPPCIGNFEKNSQIICVFWSVPMMEWKHDS